MLTIIIPSYNHEQYIIDCLSAACEVDIPGKRIIVIDDGSTDGSVQKVRNYLESKQSNCVDLICKNNSGLVSSLNIGLSMADTEFLYLVASDDIPTPLGISKCVRELQKNASCQFCIGGGEIFFENSHTIPIYGEQHDEFFKMDKEKRDKEIFLNYPSPVLLQSTVFRVKALVQIGGWDANLILDDYPTFVKLLRSFPKVDQDFVYKPEYPVVKYRYHGVNSFKNVYRQFSMVKQTLEQMAPRELQDQALGKALGRYLLAGLHVADFKGICHIVEATSWKSTVYALPAVARIMLNKLLFILK
jgi:glycosyltransferase involved in cell wall biosynthesis